MSTAVTKRDPAAAAPPAALPRPVAAPAATTPELAAPEAAAAGAAAPETAATAKKHKATASGPSGGYISEKLAVFARAVRKIWKDAKDTGKRYKAEPGGGKTTATTGATTAAPGQPEQAAVEATAPVAAGAAAAATTTATQPPSSASPRTSAAGAGGINPVTGAVQRVAEAAQTHEPADQLETHLSPAHKLSNAVVSTVEHVASEAAAVQASLTAGVREELEKMTHDSHEAQVHPAQPQQPPITSPATAAALAQPQAGTAGSTPAGMDV
ncbi:hypothetical protein CHLRE_03g173050v5 [Chlamydomonas reinhardtii]|uniref:Uncharacterized protein n=1 Tax=Chlamydomonas reinhardtii TaxID=3055 RepID=A8IED6_CHLRE|nr:uncharacterized protein CHLRE_03g173050v5 [Chlamydomonas reinhardtii]PNW85130.1 hypothetical protein CHLRE_03g173050v5 [Chlamydomonas reinhardtii]|eukprot:XP_001703299.1 predicted protein [Chlamydomonas reinhardtii]